MSKHFRRALEYLGHADRELRFALDVAAQSPIDLQPEELDDVRAAQVVARASFALLERWSDKHERGGR